MVRTKKLEAISYKTRRVKFGENWFPVDPFMNLDLLTVGKEYDADFRIDRGSYYIVAFSEKEVA